MSNIAEIKVGEQTYQLPLIEGSEGEKAIDIRKLRAVSGLVALDEGFANTGGCSSSITFIDGEKGILHHRGYPIEQVCDHASFLEVCYLLLFDKLPTQQELSEFKSEVSDNVLVPEEIKNFYKAFPRDAHPMALLSSVVCSLSSYYQHEDSNAPDHFRKTAVRLIAKLPTLAAWAYKTSIGEPLVYPDSNLGYTENFLKMMFSVPNKTYQTNTDMAKALDKLFMLHADHEQNCSATTVRVVGSSEANLYASVAAGICALWGPLHGGANQKVLEMLTGIKESGGTIAECLEMAKDKGNSFRLMGFGHRVYKNFDPRARVIKADCEKLLAGSDDPLLKIAKNLCDSALQDQYFIDRKLYPNVDFYSGLIYRAIGIPTDMFTVMFAIGRLPGWISQWKEMMDNPERRIARPRQIYTGATPRDFPPISQRG